jgi:acyl-CoA synthetase (AMP-forming)/AMP-acid ligase II
VHDNLGGFLAKRAYLTPDREAYVDSHTQERLTFRQLNARANQLVSSLLKAGLQKGERVGLLLMNSAEFMEAYFALAKAGAVVVPLNWRLVPDELEFILKDSGTQRLIYGHEFVDTVVEPRFVNGCTLQTSTGLRRLPGSPKTMRRSGMRVSPRSLSSVRWVMTCCTSCTPQEPLACQKVWCTVIALPSGVC